MAFQALMVTIRLSSAAISSGEGWLTARQGSGTRVAEHVTPPGAPPDVARPRPSAPRYDLRPGLPDLSEFPRAAWLAAARRAVSAAPSAAFGYGDPRGRRELRAELASYLARARGVRATPDQIVICSGFTQGLALLGRVLAASGAAAIAVEAYGHLHHRDVIAAQGLPARPVPVDDHGAVIDAVGEIPGAGAVLLTPSHQFPLGVPLAPQRRSQAVRWAARTGGVVIEDDYDGEFRYDRRAIGGHAGARPRARRLRGHGQQDAVARGPAGLAGAARPAAGGRRGGQVAQRPARQQPGRADPGRAHRLRRVRPARTALPAALPPPP